MYIVFPGNYSIHISTCTVIDTFSDFRGNYRYMYFKTGSKHFHVHVHLSFQIYALFPYM